MMDAMMDASRPRDERGFVLPTALVLLALLTMMSLTVYFGSLSTIRMSQAAQKTTQAYYYAETAANYMLWVLNADAELDSYANYPGNYLRNGAGQAPFAEPAPRGNLNPQTAGDFSELMAGLTNPGPVEIGDQAKPQATFDGTTGMVMYFDNTPIAARAVLWPDAKTNPPLFDKISTKLPRYIRIDIDAYGNLAPNLPKLPHADPPVIGQDIPQNGAIVWLTASIRDPYGNEADVQVIPLDPYGANAPTPIPAAAPYPQGQTATYPNGYQGPAYPSTANWCGMPATQANAQTLSQFAVACIAHDAYSAAANINFINTIAPPPNLGWLSPPRYQITIYALGYVDGKPMRLIRKTW